MVFQTAQMHTTRPTTRPTKRRLSMAHAVWTTRLLALLMAAQFALGCGESKEGIGLTHQDNTPVILISIDTLRADRLSLYGPAAAETPALDQLAADGILFEAAYSPIPLTLPAHLSMFTGLYPGKHGVRDNDGYRIEADLSLSLGPLLKSVGYETGGAVSSWVLRGVSGVREGFDFWEDSLEFGTGRAGLGGLQRTGLETLEAAEEWLAPRLDSQEPFFFFFHLYEPHAPWQPPEPFASRYESPYDGEIASADAIVGGFLDRLRAAGLYDKALIILTSDHGEGLRDHVEEEHGVLLYREAIHVPLIVKLPGNQKSGARVSKVARLIDIQPTVTEVLGLDGGTVEGRSLLELLSENAEDRLAYSETFYPRLHYGWHEQHSIVDGNAHYMEGPASELFDVQQDPKETQNLLEVDGSTAARLSRALAKHIVPLADPLASDQETQAQLAALGYIGQSVALGDGPLPDPRLHLGLLDEIKDGFRFFRQQRYEEAIELYRTVLAKNPGMLDAWEQLTVSLQAVGKPEEALEAFEQALSVAGAQNHLALAAGQLLFELGRYEEARQHTHLAKESNPVFAYELLAKIELATDQVDAALPLAQKAVELRGTRIEPFTTLAIVHAARKEFPQALEAVGRAEEAYAQKRRQTKEALEGLSLTKGMVLVNLNRYDEGRDAFLREIEWFPQKTEGYTQLAILLALQERPANEILAVLRQMVEVNDTPKAYGKAIETLASLGDLEGAQSLLAFARQRFPNSPELAPQTP